MSGLKSPRMSCKFPGSSNLLDTTMLSQPKTSKLCFTAAASSGFASLYRIFPKHFENAQLSTPNPPVKSAIRFCCKQKSLEDVSTPGESPQKLEIFGDPESPTLPAGPVVNKFSRSEDAGDNGRGRSERSSEKDLLFATEDIEATATEAL